MQGLKAIAGMRASPTLGMVACILKVHFVPHHLPGECAAEKDETSRTFSSEGDLIR